MTTRAWLTVLPLWSLFVLACGDDAPGGGATPIPLEGRLVLPDGFDLADFEVYGSAADTAVRPSADGAFTVEVFDTIPGVVFAGPRESTGLATELPDETGIFAAPYLGAGYRISRDGTGYAVGTQGAAVVDAHTTVLAFVLGHLSIASAAADVQRQQGEWLVARMQAGWPSLDSCASRYEELLLGRLDFGDDAMFVACLEQVLDEILADMPVFEAAVPYTTGRAPAVGSRVQAILLQGEHHTIASAGQVVSEVVVKQDGSREIELEVKTVTGTGLDYLYYVWPVSMDRFADGPTGQAFLSPSVIERYASGQPIAAGSISATSYFGYLDVVGKLSDWASKYIGSQLSIAPASTVKLPVPSAGFDYYAIRLFSGGYGVGAQAEVTAFVDESYSSEGDAAFRQNVAMAILEIMSLIPGADVLLGEDIAGVMVQEATTQALTKLHEILGRDGPGGITAQSVYELLYDIARNTVLKYMDEAPKKAKETGVRRLLSWLEYGGKKAARLIVALPAKVAKGGSLANRAFRLAVPDSASELWLVATGKPAALASISGSRHEDLQDLNRMWTVSVDVEWTLSGSRPEHEQGVLNPYSFYVDGDEPGTFSLNLRNLTFDPAVLTFEDPVQNTMTEYTLEEVRVVSTAEDSFHGYYGPDGATDFPHSATYRNDGVDASFTIPSPTSELDLNLVSIGLGLGFFGDYRVYERPDASSPYELITEELDRRLDTAPAYLGDSIYIEAR